METLVPQAQMDGRWLILVVAVEGALDISANWI